jgi:hypothetical protein
MVLNDVSTNLTLVAGKTVGMSGNATSIKFSVETVFNKMAETMNELSSNTIDYSSITSTMFFNALTSGPHTYNIVNVPDLSTNSHIVTILTKGVFPFNYGSAITVNSIPYSLQWNNGDNPSTIVTSELEADHIITQQICILPTNFKSNTAISNISVFKSV